MERSKAQFSIEGKEEEDLEQSYLYYQNQFQKFQLLLNQKKVYAFSQRPSTSYFKDQQCLIFKDSDTNDLQVIKKNIFFDFSTLIQKSGKALMTFKDIRYIEAKHKINKCLRVRIVKKINKQSGLYSLNTTADDIQNLDNEIKFVFIHFFQYSSLKDHSTNIETSHFIYSPKSMDVEDVEESDYYALNTQEQISNICFRQIENSNSLKGYPKTRQCYNEDNKIDQIKRYNNQISIEKIPICQQPFGKITNLNLNIRIE